MLSELVLEEALVRVLDVLREIAEEGEGRELRRELGDVLDLHVLALPGRRRRLLDDREEGLVEPCGRNLLRIVRIDFICRIEYVLDALHVEDGSEDDRDVVERGDSCLEALDVLFHSV